jgi:hypothetical protein
MHASLSAALLTIVLCGLALDASAEEYCVTCTEPAAKYRCIIGGAPSAAERTERGQLLCITELAKSGGHLSCSVGAATSGPCEGDVRTVMFPNTPEPAAPPIVEAPPASGASTAETAPPASAGVPNEPQAPQPGPPKTVEELAKKSVEASGEGLKKAGKAVTDTAQSAGNAVGTAVKKTGSAVGTAVKNTGSAVGTAVKKTWTCLSSFFGNC